MDRFCLDVYFNPNQVISVYDLIYCAVFDGFGGGFISKYCLIASNIPRSCSGTVQIVGEALMPPVLANAYLWVSYK